MVCYASFKLLKSLLVKCNSF